MNFRVLSAARAELIGAADWYDLRQPFLGDDASLG